MKGESKMYQTASNVLTSSYVGIGAGMQNAASNQLKSDNAMQLSSENRASVRELAARLARVREAISGPRPENPNADGSQPTSIIAILAETGVELRTCHDELNAIFTALGVQ